MKKLISLLIIVGIGALGGYAVWRHYLRPTRILIVNALKAQQADFTLNNDSQPPVPQTKLEGAVEHHKQDEYINDQFHLII